MESDFRIYSNITKSQSSENNKDDNDSSPLILEGIASTTGIDLDGDYMTESCIESLKEQALECNIHCDHQYGLSDVIGTVTEVIETDDDTLKIRFNVLDKYRAEIEDYLDNGINLGLSIGGTVTDYTPLKDGGWQVNEMTLHEISLTPLPANWDTFGTVEQISKGLVQSKCLNGACKILTKRKKIQHTKEMQEQKEIIKELVDAVNELKKEIQIGKAEPAEEDEPATMQDVTDAVNEAIIEVKEQIVDELKEEFDLESTTKSVDEEEIDVEVDEEDDDKNKSCDEEDKNKSGKEDEEDDDKNKSLTLKQEIIKSAKKEVIDNVVAELMKSRDPVSVTKGKVAEPKTKSQEEDNFNRDHNGHIVMSSHEIAKALISPKDYKA